MTAIDARAEIERMAALYGRRDEPALRIPPHRIDAEQAVLGGLMLAPEAWALVADTLAERAISVADAESMYSPAFVLSVDRSKRLWARKRSEAAIKPSEWVATFNKKSDPDWLAEAKAYIGGALREISAA